MNKTSELIYRKLLAECKKPINLSQLFLKTEISYSTISKYAKLFIENNHAKLVESDRKSAKLIVMTIKGKNYLEK